MSRERQFDMPDQPRLLIVDDSEQVRCLLEQALLIWFGAVEILHAGTAPEGIAVALEKKPHLILLDYFLIDTTADEVCRALLDDESMHEVPVILISGCREQIVAAQERWRNVCEAIEKPFDLRALENAIRTRIDLTDDAVSDAA